MHASSQPSNLNQKRILLGVSGGIAAYKIPDLVRKLRQAGAEVEVVLTEAASQFVAPLALQAVNGKAPRLQLLPQRQQDASLPGDAMEHISLVRWADLVVIAPATANMLARLASGQADDLLAALCLAIDRPDLPKVIVPAMNRAMWDHAQTQANLAHLQRSGWHFIGPDTGSQACGEEGKGRMTEPESIVEHLSGCFSTGALQARRVVVNAGGTHEYIDPVRFIGNRSSGRMGFALAQAAAEAGAVVDLVAGPVSLPTPDRVNRVDVVSALEMHTQVMKLCQGAHLFIACAAVADYRPAQRNPVKWKRQGQEEVSVSLVPNPDIVADAVRRFPDMVHLAFAAETHQVLEHAQDKLRSKQVDFLAVNDVSQPEIGFESSENELTLLAQDGSSDFLGRMSKTQLARRIVARLAEAEPMRRSASNT